MQSAYALYSHPLRLSAAKGTSAGVSPYLCARQFTTTVTIRHECSCAEQQPDTYPAYPAGSNQGGKCVHCRHHNEGSGTVAYHHGCKCQTADASIEPYANPMMSNVRLPVKSNGGVFQLLCSPHSAGGQDGVSSPPTHHLASMRIGQHGGTALVLPPARCSVRSLVERT